MATRDLAVVEVGAFNNATSFDAVSTGIGSTTSWVTLHDPAGTDGWDSSVHEIHAWACYQSTTNSGALNLQWTLGSTTNMHFIQVQQSTTNFIHNFPAKVFDGLRVVGSGAGKVLKVNMVSTTNTMFSFYGYVNHLK